MTKARTNSSSSTAQSFEQLGERYRKLDRQKTTAEANLKNAEAQLDRLRQEARQKFGTDDIAELERKLAEMEAQNEQRRSDYQTALDQIEQNLAAVETSLQAPTAND